MKNTIKLFLIIVFIAVIGFSFAACGDPPDGTPGDNTPGDNNPGNNPPVNNNQVGGKIFYEGSWRKIEFAESTGTYKGYEASQNKEGFILENDKFTWIVNETGTYTWNESAKTVTLKTEKIIEPDFGEGLLDKAAVIASINAQLAEYTQEQIEEMLAESGFSTVQEVIDYYIGIMFADRPYVYSFSTDGTLFMRPALPQPKGTDELAGRTYYGMTWDDDEGETVKDPDNVYVFGANKTYTHTSTYDSVTGSYSYDSTKKIVYLDKVTINGKTAVEFYEAGVFDWLDEHFINEATSKAAQTNGTFAYYNDYQYDTTENLIGWFDD